MTISSLIVAMVASVFLVQNSFYASVIERSEVQDNLRSVTQLIASETRGVAPGGVLLADSTMFAFRVPMRVGGVCEKGGKGDARIRIPDLAQMVTTDVGGYAIDDGAGNWDFRWLDWPLLFKSKGGKNAERCADNGADTAGIAPEFVQLDISDNLNEGDLVMIFRGVQFSIDTSLLDPTHQGLFRGLPNGVGIEVASGFTGVTHFQYRLGTPTYQTNVAPANLQFVDGIRLIVVSESNRTATGGYSYGWTVDIPLKNSR